MLTILVPSKDRKIYLQRSVDYYLKSGHKIITVSNTPLQDERVDEIISEQPFIERIEESFRFLNSEFCILSPDDDFISFDYLEKAIQYLNKNKDVCAVVAKYMTFNEEDFSYNRLVLKMPAHLQNDPLLRIKNGIENYSNNFWIVYRTSVFKKIINATKQITNYNLVEILFKVISLYEGKIGYINTVYLLRGYSPNSWGRNETSALEYLLNNKNKHEIAMIQKKMKIAMPDLNIDILKLIIKSYAKFNRRRTTFLSTISMNLLKLYCKVFFSCLLTKKEKYFLESVKKAYKII